MFMPAAHVFEFMRAALGDRDASWGSLWVAVGLDLVYLAGAFAFARSMLARFLRRGDITRYI